MMNTTDKLFEKFMTTSEGDPDLIWNKFIFCFSSVRYAYMFNDNLTLFFKFELVDQKWCFTL